MNETETKTKNVTVEPEGPLSSSIERLRKEFDRWVEAAMSRGGQALDVFRTRGAGEPAVDVLESADGLTVVMELPGVAVEDLEVALSGNMLTVSGTRAAVDTVGQTVHIQERCGGVFTRSIPLPVPIEEELVTAQSRDGVLTVRLPKAERAKPKKIKVSTGTAESTRTEEHSGHESSEGE